MKIRDLLLTEDQIAVCYLLNIQIHVTDTNNGWNLDREIRKDSYVYREFRFLLINNVLHHVRTNIFN